MAGFMDMLGKKTEMENGSSYQKTIIREIARKLMELEEQNDQNAMAIEEVKKLQKTIVQKLDSLRDSQADQTASVPAGMTGIEDLQKQVRALTLQLQSSVDSLSGRLQESVENLDGKLQKNAESVDVKFQDVMNKISEQPEKDGNAQGGEDILDKLDAMKLSLEDTVHKENIKCFRNIQGALEEQGDGKAYDFNALRRYLKVIIWFQLIIIAILVLRILGLL